MKHEIVLASGAPREVRLRGDQRLRLERGPERDRVELSGPEGKVTLSIEVMDSGPVLRFEGAALRIQAAGELSLEAEQLHLHGRSGLHVSTGGDLCVVAQGDVKSEARIQTIKARLGNVEIEANDDVHIDGERVMVNC